MADKLIMIVDIDGIAKNEGYLDALPKVLAVNHQSPLELHPQEGLAVNVTGDKSAPCQSSVSRRQLKP